MAGLLWLDGAGALNAFELAGYAVFVATLLSFFIKPKRIAPLATN
ncbi:hypothetical protein N8Z89_00240 [bacterium]|nr:hypothetical protein [bacterium]